MNGHKIFWEYFILILIITALHFTAMQFDLYWRVGEFDSLMHFLSGAWVALAALRLYFFSNYFRPLKRGLKDFLAVATLAVIFISVLWEIFELAVGATFVEAREYSFDTSLDFIMDILGGIAAALYAYMREIPSFSRVEKIVEPPANLPV